MAHSMLAEFEEDANPGLMVDLNGDSVLYNSTVGAYLNMVGQEEVDISLWRLQHFDRLDTSRMDNKLAYKGREWDIKVIRWKRVKVIRNEKTP